MEEKRAISINDWITTPEGICQVVGIQDYVEVEKGTEGIYFVQS
jgi:hypothetical protein